MKISKIIAVVMSGVITVSMLASCGKQEVQTDGDTKNVTLKFLDCWQGETAPKDLDTNPVAKAIKEKTGITLQTEFTNVDEIQKLNLVFASGDMPDIISAPFWGGNDAATVLIKKAAAEGMLLPLDEYMHLAPSLGDVFTQGLAVDFKEQDIDAADGNHYIMPSQIPATTEDVANNAECIYVRQDILDALGVDPQKDINTSEDLYQLAKRIKSGSFTDINDKPVIPISTWHSGQLMHMLYASYVSYENFFSGYSNIDGQIIDNNFTPRMDQQILFMRKLMSEGLFDVEASTHNTARAKEKLVTGSVAIIPSPYSWMKDALQNSLYETNPEMKYVPIAPLINADNERGMSKLKGAGGAPVILISKTCKDPESVFALLEFLNSDEGEQLLRYGVIGTHSEMVDGKPRLTDEWLAKYKEDPKSLINEGINSIYTRFLVKDRRMSHFGEFSPGEALEQDADYEFAKTQAPIVNLLEGFRIFYFEYDYPEISKIYSLKPHSKILETQQRAYYADSDEAALKIYNDFRQQLLDGGMADLHSFITDKAKTRTDLIY